MIVASKAMPHTTATTGIQMAVLEEEEEEEEEE